MDLTGEPPFAEVPPQWPVRLEHGDVVLRPFRNGDRMEWEAVRERNREWLRPWDATSPIPGGAPRSFRAMVRQMNQDARDGQMFPWLLCVRDTPTAPPRIAGQLVVASVQWGSALNASIGYWIDRERAGRGIMPRAAAMATDFLIFQVGLHRVEINIVPENGPSHRVVEKLGFRYEGLRKNYLHINGEWKDHNTFALTAEEILPHGLLKKVTHP